MRIVVLVSGSGTLLQAMLDAKTHGELNAEIVAVGSDNPSAYGLERAKNSGIETFVHRYRKGENRAVWDAQLTELVAGYQPDLVVSAGFMKLVGATFLSRFAGRTINTHPALLPAFPGMHGPRDALEYGVKISGATVFMVDEGVDTGRILAQAAVPVHDDDDVETLHERIKIVERRLLIETVNQLANHLTKGRNV